MSLYRSILAALAAVAIASPVFADDTTTSTTTTNDTTGQSATSSMSSSDTTATKINVNTATVKQLIKVKGLTKANAKAIVAYRKAHGNFQTINDLTSNVKGLSKLKTSTTDQLTTE